MKKSILYITYVNSDDLESGAGVRPSKMYNAFLKSGYKIKVLSGVASHLNRENRLREIENIKVWLKTNTPIFCYIESPTDPLIFKEDRELIKFIYKKSIKIGYFYRDAYYKLGKNIVFASRKKTLKSLLKYLYYKLLFYRDEKFLRKYVNIVYFPSDSMSRYFKFKDKKILPPAGDKKNNNIENNKSLIYVGGISKRYGIDIMLNALEFINRSQYIELILVCRKKEINNIDKRFFNYNWLKIYNVSGDKKLELLYKKAKIALLPKEKCIYNDFAISIKLFEYMGYGLPIVATDSNETNKIIKKYKIGIITSCDYKDFAEGILKIYNNDDLCKEISLNSKKAIIKNQWSNRVAQVIDDLK